MTNMTNMLEMEKIYSECFPKVYNYFYYRILHKENAEDLTAKTFLKVMEKFDSYDGTKASMETWVLNIAKNTLIDYYRMTKKEFSYDAEEGYISLLTVSFEKQYEEIVATRQKALYRALAQLPDRERALVYEKYLLGRSYRELAKKFEMKESTVATVLQRAKEKLRVILEKEL